MRQIEGKNLDCNTNKMKYMWVKDREEEEGGGLLSGKSKNNKKNMIKEIDKIQEVKDNLLQA